MGTRYEIRVRERISPGWAAWLGGMEVAPLPDGATILRGELSDQPALFGVLARVRDLGLTLISVRQLGTDEPEGALSCAQE